MNEWWLIGILMFFTLLASVAFIYPLRSSYKLGGLFIPLIFVSALSGYYFWGGFAGWQHYTHQKNSQIRAQQMLKSIKNPQELIAKLKAKLDKNPESAKGWYLLGRIYSTQQANHEALEAFAKAYHLKPGDEQFAVNYAHSLWQSNNQQFNPEIIKIFNSLLRNNPKQPDALAMLAMNAFMSHAYEDAINYWQRLLVLAPEQSDEALAIRKAIANAQEKIRLE